MEDVDPSKLNLETIRAQAISLGWQDCGITTPYLPERDRLRYLEWLREGKQGNLQYMENVLRENPTDWFPGAKSIIMFLSYYKQKKVSFEQPVVASYARGRDYHNVHRKRLKKMVQWLEETSQQQDIARPFSDSSPILEKVFAVQSGLGWIGKNTLLIHRKYGTFTLLSGIITRLALPTHPPVQELNRCGTCERCLEACPTQALTPFSLDARRCISYHLIESKNAIPEFVQKNNPGYVFGCDLCQDACPHNWNKPESNSLEFSPSQGIGAQVSKERFQTIKRTPERLFGTPLQRRKVAGLERTLDSLEAFK